VIGAGFAAASQGCGRILASSPMPAIGRVSYSWYLWHWPVLCCAGLSGPPAGLVGRLAAALVFRRGWPCSPSAFHREPVRFAAPIRRSALASLALGGVATAVAVCVGWRCCGLGANPAARGAPAAAAIWTAARFRRLNRSTRTTRRCSTRSRVQAAVAGSAKLKPSRRT